MRGSKLFLILMAIACSAGDNENNEINKVILELGVIPDVLDRAPREFLKVTYPSKVMVNKGAELTPTQVKDEPVIEWTADANSYYTVIMTGIDAPNRQDPYWREWLHWFVVNIPGTDIEEGEVLSPYIGAGVPKAAGLSRFVFYVFKQTERMVFDEEPLNVTSVAGHSNFNTRKFAEKYGMGDPIAVNVFQARWDEYVPILLQQLNVKDIE